MKTSQIIKDRLYQYWLLMRFHKPIGIFLLLWPTLWALWIASAGKPDWHVMFVFVTGVVLMRAAGCVINDYADRNIDLHVARTNTRPLTAGQVSAKEALILFVVLCLTAFGLVLTLNTFTILLSFGGAALAIIYPFMKRYTHLPQVVLGMAFGWAVPMAFAAQTNEVPRVAWMLYVLAIIWPVIYDTMYAMVDREDDLKIGVKSTAILFGDADRIIIAGLQLILFAGFWLLGKQLELGFSYYFGLFLAAILAAYHQYLIRDRHPAACFKAFLHNNWLGAAIFLGLVFEYL
ncbi:MAG: 4-hydroxybenzoate octaprenyltransferase [Gammaproteobacteria bacterium]|nr:4-hydroxybenzoate octaprenyltransferase [Gammaproteobacteria bacterium]MDH5653218.1 4-hydroxybenzoate octaprenyltransferase [Gammaproteobacteria bacterium]